MSHLITFMTVGVVLALSVLAADVPGLIDNRPDTGFMKTISDLLDPWVSDEQFFAVIAKVMDECRASSDLKEALKQQLTEPNIIHLSRQFSQFLIVTDADIVEEAIRFFIEECGCKSLAGFMIGLLSRPGYITDPDVVAVINNVLKPHFDESVIVEIIPEQILEILQNSDDRDELGVSILQKHLNLILETPKSLSALLQIGIKLNLDLEKLPNLTDLTLNDLQILAPYCRMSQYDFDRAFVTWMSAGRYDMIVEVLRSRSLVKSAQSIPDVLYVYCCAAINFEQQEILESFLGIPKIFNGLKQWATNKPVDYIRRSQGEKLPANSRLSLLEGTNLDVLNERLLQELKKDHSRPQYL